MKIYVCNLLLLPLLLLFCCHCLVAARGKVDAVNQHGILTTNPRLNAVRLDVKVDENTSEDHFLNPNSIRADFPCPESGAIAPCTCAVYSENRVYLDCTSVESIEQLVDVFKQDFPVKELVEFSMGKNSAITMFPGFMNGITFERIFLNPGPFNLMAVSDHFLFDLKDTLNYLYITESKLATDFFPFYLLPSMNHLESLSIYSSNINWIPPIRAPKLHEFVLVNSALESLDNGTFAIGTGWMTIWVFNNQIHTVEEGSFFFADQDSADSNDDVVIYLWSNRLQSLKARSFPLRNGHMYIDLNFNQISSVEPGTFVLPASTDLLRFELHLINNNLTTVDEAVFGSLMPFVVLLTLQGNPLTCGCDIAWLILNENFMATVDYNASCANGTSLIDLDPQQFIDSC